MTVFTRRILAVDGMQLALALTAVQRPRQSRRCRNSTRRLARRQHTARAWELAPETAAVLRGLESLEPASSGHVPNYLRALALKPATVKAFAHLMRTFVYDGELSPALKLAMATRIAQVNRSAYGAAHLTELLLQATGADGQALLARLRANQIDQLPPAERLALRWAELQTQGHPRHDRR